MIFKLSNEFVSINQRLYYIGCLLRGEGSHTESIYRNHNMINHIRHVLAFFYIRNNWSNGMPLFTFEPRHKEIGLREFQTR